MADGDELTGDVTRILADWQRGDQDAFNRLLPIIYDELKRLARRQLRQLRSANDTLNTTALVHEAYLKLADRDGVKISDRHHFLAVAATAMRHILVDYARRSRAAKRGGGQTWSLDEADAAVSSRQVDVIAMSDAITKLAALEIRLARLVELRVFAGLSVDEAAAALEISDRTVKRDWQKARAFLVRELTGPVGN